MILCLLLFIHPPGALLSPAARKCTFAASSSPHPARRLVRSRNTMGSADDFQFPFSPYPVQLELMDAVYGVLKEGQVGIFESPTGTGKSMSLICSSLRWLKENPVYVPPADGTAAAAEDEDLPAWVLSHARKREEEVRDEAIKAEKERLARARLKMEEDALQRERDREKCERQRAKQARPTVGMVAKKPHGDNDLEGGRGEGAADTDNVEETRRLVLSDSEENEKRERSADDVLKMLFGDSEDSLEARRDETSIDVRKVIYCSRTHSQLSQFMREVKRTAWGRDLKAVALASRKSMCINEDVTKLKSAVRINAACLDLCKNGAKDAEAEVKDVASARKRQQEGSGRGTGGKCKGGCPYLDDDRTLDMRDTVLSKVQDIEDVVNWGKKTKTCPYYGSRAAIKAAELVTIPYNSLVHAGTREALGLSLEGNVVIIDEAHNLIDCINGVHSAVLSQATVSLLLKLFSDYLDKFVTRLSPKNAALLRQVIKLLRLLDAFFRTNLARGESNKSSRTPASRDTASNHLDALHAKGKQAGEVGVVKGGRRSGESEDGGGGRDRVMSVAEFSINAGLGNINLFEMVRYFETSKILHKLHGYYERRTQEYNSEAGLVGDELGDSAVSVVQPLHTFIHCLTEAEEDGRVALYVDDKSGQAHLSYQLLNAAAHFKDVIEKSHALVLAGGTMQPMSDYVQQLMPTLARTRLRTLSVGHVIPDDNILPLTLSSGPTGLRFDLRHGARGDPAMMEELARVVHNVCCIVPDGVVLFLPSYSYEDQLYKFWESKGYVEKIEKRKKILREPRNSGDTEAVLDTFAAHINNNYARTGTASSTDTCNADVNANPSNIAQAPRCTGALLLSVVGGKLSEGINFSDGLGRCVMVAGLPFANAADPRLREKIKYISSLPAVPALEGQGGAEPSVGKKAGQEYYQNMCMKAVNQCIGRAIRHVGDYAAIILIDHRYQTDSVRSKIAGWIRERLHQVVRASSLSACMCWVSAAVEPQTLNPP